MLKNTLINLAGSVASGAFMLVSVPLVIDAFGVDVYGLITLLLVVLGYGAILDIGITPAVTREVARSLGNSGDDALTTSVWTGAVLQASLGTMAALLVWSLAPVISLWLLGPSAASREEFTAALRIIAVCLPLQLVQSVLIGTLTGVGRFGLMSSLKALGQVASHMAMIVGVWCDLDLAGLAWLVVASRFLLLVVTVLAVCSCVPLSLPKVSSKEVAALAASGGWFAAGGLADPIIFYMDRVVIAKVLGATAMAYYVVPFELVSRTWIVSAALAPVLFAAVAQVGELSRRGEIGNMYRRASNLLMLAWAPLALSGCAFGESILKAWAGPEVAGAGSGVLRLALISSPVDVLVIVSAVIFGASGNARLVAIAKWTCLPLYSFACFVFASIWGVTGVAAAMAILRLVYASIFAANAEGAGVPGKEIWAVSARALLWSALSGAIWLGVEVNESAALPLVAGALSVWLVAVVRWILRDEEMWELISKGV